MNMVTFWKTPQRQKRTDLHIRRAGSSPVSICHPVTFGEARCIPGSLLLHLKCEDINYMISNSPLSSVVL